MIVASSLRSTRTAAFLLFMILIPTVKARCRHCFGIAHGDGCDGHSNQCPLRGVWLTQQAFSPRGVLMVADFVRLLSRVEPPA